MKGKVGSWQLVVGSARRKCLALCAFLLILLPIANCQLPTARAATQEEVFKSLNENIDQQTDYSRLIPWLCGLAGIVVVVIFFRQRQKAQAFPKPLNHPGKLVREMARLAELDPADMKKFKALAKDIECDNPLTLMLCPSLWGGESQKSEEPAAVTAEPDHKTQ